MLIYVVVYFKHAVNEVIFMTNYTSVYTNCSFVKFSLWVINFPLCVVLKESLMFRLFLGTDQFNTMRVFIRTYVLQVTNKTFNKN